MKKMLMTFFILSVISVSASAAEKAVFVFEKYAPFESLENGKAQGISINIINNICKEIGIDPVYQEVPWARALDMVKSGEADAIFSILYKKERESFITYTTKTLYKQPILIISKKGSGKNARKLDDIKGDSIGVVRGNAYGDIFAKFTNYKKDESTDVEELLKKIDGGRVDYAIVNEAGLKHYSEKLNMKDKFDKCFTIEVLNYYIAFSKAKGDKGKALADKFNSKLK